MLLDFYGNSICIPNFFEDPNSVTIDMNINAFKKIEEPINDASPKIKEIAKNTFHEKYLKDKIQMEFNNNCQPKPFLDDFEYKTHPKKLSDDLNDKSYDKCHEKRCQEDFQLSSNRSKRNTNHLRRSKDDLELDLESHHTNKSFISGYSQLKTQLAKFHAENTNSNRDLVRSYIIYYES